MGVWLRVDHWPTALGRHPRLRCGVLHHVANRTLSFHGIVIDAVQFLLPLFESWTFHLSLSILQFGRPLWQLRHWTTRQPQIHLIVDLLLGHLQTMPFSEVSFTVRAINGKFAELRSHISSHPTQQPPSVPPPPAAPPAVSIPRVAPPRFDPTPDPRVNLRCRRSGFSSIVAPHAMCGIAELVAPVPGAPSIRLVVRVDPECAVLGSVLPSCPGSVPPFL